MPKSSEDIFLPAIVDDGTDILWVRLLVKWIVVSTEELVNVPADECQLRVLRMVCSKHCVLPPPVNEANDASPLAAYSSVHEVVLERTETGELALAWDDSRPVELVPPAEEVEDVEEAPLVLWIADELMDDGKLPVPVGRIEEVAFPVTNDTFDDKALASPNVLDDRGREPVPVGPVEMVELAGFEYGAEDEMIPPARLGRLTVPVGLYVEVPFPWVYGPTELLVPPTTLEELGELPVPVGPRGVVEFEIGYGTEDGPTEELIPPEMLEVGTYPELRGPIEEETGVAYPLARLEEVG
jgi:hypothetical protein